MDIKFIIRDYKKRKLCKALAELNEFRTLPTFDQCINNAALAIHKNGKRYRHQYWISKKTLFIARDILLDNKKSITGWNKESKYIVKKNKLWIFFVLIGMVFIVLFYCGSLVLVRSSSLQFFPKIEKTPNEWTQKLLNNPTCQLPCWENITPGETLIKNAPTLISVVQGARIITYPTVAEGSGIIQMQWSLDSDSNTPDYAEVNGLSSDGTIYTIVLGVDKNKHLPINDVIKAYGEPEYLHVYYCNSNICLFRLLYAKI
jgi:hypothetical protein